MQQQYTAEERERAMRMAAEVNAMRRQPALALTVDIFDLFRVIGSLQLAWRHPSLDDEQRAAIERFARQLQAAFAADCPETARTLEQGWHREFDR